MDLKGSYREKMFLHLGGELICIQEAATEREYEGMFRRILTWIVCHHPTSFRVSFTQISPMEMGLIRVKASAKSTATLQKTLLKSARKGADFRNV